MAEDRCTRCHTGTFRELFPPRDSIALLHLRIHSPEAFKMMPPAPFQLTYECDVCGCLSIRDARVEDGDL